MSQNQKMLKIMSFVAVIATLGMAWWSSVAIAFANSSPGLLLALCSVVPCVLDLFLGVWGIGAANRPARAYATPYVGLTLLALVLNAVAVVVYVFLNGFVWPAIANLVIVAVYYYFSRAVRIEALR